MDVLQVSESPSSSCRAALGFRTSGQMDISYLLQRTLLHQGHDVVWTRSRAEGLKCGSYRNVTGGVQSRFPACFQVQRAKVLKVTKAFPLQESR